MIKKYKKAYAETNQGIIPVEPEPYCSEVTFTVNVPMVLNFIVRLCDGSSFNFKLGDTGVPSQSLTLCISEEIDMPPDTTKWSKAFVGTCSV